MCLKAEMFYFNFWHSTVDFALSNQEIKIHLYNEKVNILVKMEANTSSLDDV